MLKIIAMLLSLCLGVFAGADAFAVTFNFGSQNSGPRNPLIINGITVTADGAGLPATVLGSGLGNAMFGRADYLDTTFTTIPGLPMLGGDTPLTIQVNGAINSFTIGNVYMVSIEEPPLVIPAIQIPFQIGYYGNDVAWGGPRWEYVNPLAGTPYTFHMPDGVPPVDSLLIMNAAASDPSPGFMDILAPFHYPPITFTYGFTITSIDYTPAQSVPEMGTMLLLCSGMIGCAGLRRRFRS